MRTLYIGQNSLAAKGASVIRDVDHRSIYLLIGKWGRRQDALSLYRISGDLIAELRQTTLGIRPQFDIYQHNQKIGSLSRHIGLFNEMIYISSLHWLVVGNFHSGNYRVYHGTSLVMESHRQDDQRILTVTAEKDEPVCICIAATLDHWAHRRSMIRSPFPARWRLNLEGGAEDFKGLHAHYQLSRKIKPRIH